jgi:arylsulfatase
VFEEQRVPGTLRIWAEPFTKLRLPKIFDLRADPYERADITSNTYWDWYISNPAPFLGSQPVVAKFLATFKDYPPSQRPSSFSIDQIVEKMQRNFAPSGD